MAKIGRPRGSKKYKAAGFRKACEDYFKSISYEVPARRQEPILDEDEKPILDDYGHIQYRFVQIITADGAEAKELRWTEPPSIQGLCLYLGIDTSTFWRYTKPEDEEDEESKKLAKEAELVKARVEAYLIRRLEDKGAAAGTKFNLQHNFGWMEKKEIELGAGAQRAAAAANMTMEEKWAALQEMGVVMPE